MKLGHCKGLGIKLVPGDYIDGCEVGEAKDTAVYNLYYQSHCHLEITSFCWRKGKPPKNTKYKVETSFGLEQQYHSVNDIKSPPPQQITYWRPLLTQSNRYSGGGEISVGQTYISHENEECEMIGSNVNQRLIIGKVLRDNVHPDYLSVCSIDDIKPIPTDAEKQADELYKSCLRIKPNIEGNHEWMKELFVELIEKNVISVEAPNT